MKKLLVLLAVTALALGVFAACTDKAKENAPVETTTVLTVLKTEVVTEETSVAPEVTKAPEVQTTIKAEKISKENKPEAPLPDSAKATNTEVKVAMDEAKKTALTHAGLAENDVKSLKAELDRERNGLVYEVEFDAGKYEYDYEVDAETGKVLKSEKELRD